MKVITNALIEKASGKLGTSVVFYQNAGRQCARIFFIPTNPRTDLQVLCRNAIKAASQWWSITLNDSQRAAWNTFAADVVTRSGQLGLPYKRTGQQLAVASYQLQGLTNNTASVYTIPENPAACPEPTSITAVYDKSDGTLTMNFTMPAFPDSQELFALPKMIAATSAAQTPTEAKSRLLLKTTADVIAFAQLTSGPSGDLVFSKTDFPALALFDTAAKGYVYLSLRCSNSGIENPTPLKVNVTIQA